MIRAQGATLREFQVLLKAKDPGFGDLNSRAQQAPGIPVGA
jgi:hypothetical protein